MYPWQFKAWVIFDGLDWPDSFWQVNQFDVVLIALW